MQSQYNDIDVAAKLLQRPGLRRICNCLGVTAVTVEDEKEGATKHALVFASPDDIEVRSQDLAAQAQPLIGVRFVEDTGTRSPYRRVEYLASGSVPVFNDGDRSILDVISWCALSPDVATNICSTAKVLYDETKRWTDDEREGAYDEFNARLAGITPEGITDMAVRGAEAEAAKLTRFAAAVPIKDAAGVYGSFDVISKQQIAEGIRQQLAGPAPVAPAQQG